MSHTKLLVQISNKITYVSLFALAVGVMTSISMLSVFQGLIVLAALCSIFSYQWSRFPLSARVLLLLALVLEISVLFNFGSYQQPWKAFLKTRYYLAGALAIIPFDFFFNDYLESEARLKILKRLFKLCLLAANLASLSGLVGYFTGFNPLLIAQVDAHRSAGTFGLSITYGHSVAWFSVFLISLWFHKKEVKDWFPNWYLLVSILISSVGLFTSHTRGAILAWLAGCLAINRRIALLCLSLFLVGSVGASLINKDFITNQVIRSGSNEERLGCWMGAWQAFKNKPIIGYGFLNYDSFSVQIKKEHGFPRPGFQGNAHNDYLELLASGGAISLLVFLAWIMSWIRDVSRQGSLAKGLVIPFIIAFLVSGLTQVTFNTSENLIFLMAFYALSIVFKRGPIKSRAN